MSAMTRAVLTGAAALLILKALWRAASPALGLEYALVTTLMIAVYLVLGEYVGLGTEGLRPPMIAGGATGLVEAAIDWVIRAAIGPGASDPGTTAGGIAWIVVFATLPGAGIAAIGAWAGRRLRARAARRQQ
jgi:hypothetical protein